MVVGPGGSGSKRPWRLRLEKALEAQAQKGSGASGSGGSGPGGSGSGGSGSKRPWETVKTHLWTVIFVVCPCNAFALSIYYRC